MSPRGEGVEYVGYRVAVPRACADDRPQLESFAAMHVEDLPRLAGLAQPDGWRVLDDTVQVRWSAYRLPELDDDGKVRVMAQSQPWEIGKPVPEWAEVVVLWVTAKVVRR